MSDRNVKLTGRELFEYLTGSRFNMTKEQAIANMREHNQDMSFLEEEKDMITLNLGTTDLLIDILREHIFKDMPEADSATHPIEMALLDLLIEKRNEVKFDTDKEGVETIHV